MRLRWSSFTPYSPRDDLSIILRQPCCYARCWPWLTLMILKAIPTPDHSIKRAFAEGLTSLDRVFCCSVVLCVCAFDARLAQPITILNGLAAQASLNASWRQNPSSDLQLGRNRYNQSLSGHRKTSFHRVTRRVLALHRALCSNGAAPTGCCRAPARPRKGLGAGN